MRIYAEIYDNYEQLKATDNLMPPGMDPKVLKDYRLLLLDRVNGWRMSVNLTIFILSYPMPKIARLILLISEADTLDDATKGYNHIFECIDYLSKTPYNSRKSIAKKLQRINDFTMSHQSTFNHNWHVLQLHEFSKKYGGG